MIDEFEEFMVWELENCERFGFSVERPED